MKMLFVKIKDILKLVWTNNCIYIIGVVLFTYKGLLLNHILDMEIGKEMYILTALIPMILMFPCINNIKKISFLYANILYLIITILIFSNFIYYNYSTNFLSIYQIENLKYGKEIGLALEYLISIKDILLFFIDNLLFGILSIYVYKKRKYSVQDIVISEESDLGKKKKRKSRILKFVFFVFVILLNIIAMLVKVERTHKYYTYNKTLMVEHISIYYYHVEDIKDYMLEQFYKEKVDYKILEDIYNQSIKNKEVNNELTGIAKEKNVIIIQLESLNNYVIGKMVNGKEITPNLNQFLEENIYVTEMYNQGLGTTADSEHTMATSMYPLENGRVFQKYYNNKWNDIYSVLKENGYYTSFMHPNINTFWNRYEVYNKGYGIQEYNDISKFIKEGEFAGEFFSDESFFLQAVDILEGYEEPFCSILVSVSTHIPYSLEGISNLREKLDIDVSDIEDEEFRNYLLSCNFVDYSFGKLMEKLQQERLLENSILVVYGDHGASISNNEEVELLFIQNGVEYTKSIEKLLDVNIPFGLKVPGLEKMKINRAVSKIDIKPTILNLLGITDSFSFGEDIFTNKNYSYMKGIGFVTDNIYYIDGEYIDRKTNEKIDPDEELIYLTYKMNDDIVLSDTIIRNNLLIEFL